LFDLPALCASNVDASVFDDSALVSGGNLTGAFICAPLLLLHASSLSQQEVFKNELALTTGKRRTANAAD
jgi:hypothetical protein